MWTRWLFWFFLLSGFASLVYEVVWLRLAMAAFGVTTPFVSIVLSVFMGGIALGSWAAGRLARRIEASGPALEMRLYALAEALIGLCGVSVPALLWWGRALVERLQGQAAWSGATYSLVAGAWIALVLLPATACMGATFPLAMSAIRKIDREERSFSRLYLANVVGAAAGTLASAFVLIEILGFRGTLWATASLNAALALAAVALSLRLRAAERREPGRTVAESTRPGRGLLALLFATGLLSMAMEVVWVRQFTPFMGSLVYAFASILATYLLATFAGSAIYRWWSARRPGEQTGPLAWTAAGTLALAPLACADPYAPLPWGLPLAELRIALGIAPVAAAFGFLTPMLVDRFSAGDPHRAGRAYAVNVIGCILGPLLACFALLPAIGERGAILACALPLFGIGLVWGGTAGLARAKSRRASKPAVALLLATAAALVLGSRDFGSLFPDKQVRRDATATAIATGRGRTKQLYVNGTAITSLTPITKMMVHLPMAWRRQPPRDVLAICFGMGTSFRSALAWGVPSTAVELAPSVAELFHWFHRDAQQVLRRPEGKIVIDDGRRYLERTPFQYDVITVDPPPPVEAAGSSLLYSREFYRLVKKRLRKGGILQQWSPTTDRWTLASIIRALEDEFPHVRGFQAFDDWGVHFLASEEPLENVSATDLGGRLPPEAAADLVEWGPFQTAEQQFQALLSREVALDVDAFAPGAPALTDDRPVNEYYLLRRLFGNASR